jgi:hypothetical protein
VRKLSSLLAGLLVLALVGCESTQERSARLRARAARIARQQQQGVTVARQNPNVEILSKQLISGPDHGALVVTLRNTTSRPLVALPLSFAIKDAQGKQIFSNATPGLQTSLVTINLLPAHGRAVWVDDQIFATQGRSADVRVGDPRQQPPARLPRIEVSRRLTVQRDETGSSEAVGRVTNRSALDQRQLVIYVVGRSGSRIVAAGRAIIPRLRPGGTAPLHAFLVGDPSGARLTTAVAPATLR